MKRRSWLSLIFSILLVLGSNIINCAEISQKEEFKIQPIKKVEPKLMLSLKVGMGENEIPNSLEEGGLCYSPQNFFVDYNNNYYIFIHGLNSIEKISSNGKIIKKYNLNKYATFISSVFYDKSLNRIYALSSFQQKILIFNSELQLVNEINIEKLMKNENESYFTRIKVINKNIYIYYFASRDCLVISEKDSTKNDIRYYRSPYFIIDNKIFKMIRPYLTTNKDNDQVFQFIDNINKKSEIKLPNLSEKVIWGSFLTSTDFKIFIYLQTGIIDNYGNRLMVIDNNKYTSVLGLKKSGFIYELQEPLIDIDKNGIIYQVCLENNKYRIYSYKI